MKLYQSIGILIIILYVLVIAAVVAAVIYLFTLVVKALKKYINSAEVREEKKVIRRSLGEELKARRVQCKMTQEFVADALGVSRQAVSKWENGTVDPSTSNLLSLAKLYGLSPEALLQNVDPAIIRNRISRRIRTYECEFQGNARCVQTKMADSGRNDAEIAGSSIDGFGPHS